MRAHGNAIASDGRESTRISLPIHFGDDVAVKDIVLQFDDLDAGDARVECGKDVLQQVVGERADISTSCKATVMASAS